MTVPVLAIGEWATNGDLIADAARLGYITGRTLDPTYGAGGFWTRHRPDQLTTHDLELDGVDARHLPHDASSFDTVVFDPPYKLNGTGSAPDERYGVAGPYTSRAGRHDLLLDGTTECARVLRAGGHLLVKCQDQVNSGRVRWQTDLLTRHAEGLALVKVDALLFRSYRPQPAGRRQVHARRNYSTLLVFRNDRSADPQLALATQP